MEHAERARHPINREVTKVNFSFYTAEDIKHISVKTITNPETFDNLGRPLPGGLYDPHLGPIDRKASCPTCELGADDCPGHVGCIDLPVPVYNPIVFPLLYRLLRSKCFHCHKLRAGRTKVNRVIAKLTLLKNGELVESSKVDLISKVKEKNAEGPTEEDQLDELMTKIRAMKTSGEFVKNAHVEQASREVTERFWKDVGACKTCENCQQTSPSLRKDGYVKIFQMPLSASGAKKLKKSNLKMRTPGEAQTVDDIEKEMMEKVNGEQTENGKTSDDEDNNEEDFKPSITPEESLGTRNPHQPKYLHPMEAENHVKRLWEEEKEILSLVFGTAVSVHANSTSVDHGLSFLFIKVLPVLPNRFRPTNVMGTQMFNHPQNLTLKKILLNVQEILRITKESGESDIDLPKIISEWITLQINVNGLIDSTKGTPEQARDGPSGIRQDLEKKEGLFRKNMMGKRVNYAARSVISPDPYIDTCEIGIPLRFAKKLTFPEPVNPFNVDEMRQAVINGPEKHPGANYIIVDGQIKWLTNMPEEKRIAEAKTLLAETGSHRFVGAHETVVKKVGRHLKTGDPLLVNRQPTLHKPGIMAHKARVLNNEKVIRMHYANCNTYNADFDGDEINLHFPQSELARSEAYHIALTDHQYLVPTSGNPLRGLIQDHCGSGVLLTKRDTFLTREEYMQLVHVGCSHESLANNGAIKLELPTIWKPKPLWTGKQVITTLLNYLTKGRPPLTFTGKAKVPARLWDGKVVIPPNDGEVVFQDNELLTGVLDKSQFGASAFGFVHSCYELYGPTNAGIVLTLLSRLFTFYLQLHGFTCGMEDLVLRQHAEEFRKDELDRAEKEGVDVSAAFGEIKSKDKSLIGKAIAAKLLDPSNSSILDGRVKMALNPITSSILGKCLDAGMVRDFPKNAFQLMTHTGAKGSTVNISQIACLLGQQELEGQRVPRMVNGKTLPCFEPYDPSARAGGYIRDRFLTGIRPQEYFFHCMAGREGLVDTAVKTSRSGYLQRCLIKGLEGLKVNYDYTVRNSDGCVFQFHYGEDAVDVTKKPHLNKFSFLIENFNTYFKYKYPAETANTALRDGFKAVSSYQKKMAKARKKGMEMDPVISEYLPGSHLGAVSEKFEKELKEYIAKNPDGLIDDGTKPTKVGNRTRPTPKEVEIVAWLKYLNSLADPGESVGLLAAQSIGEPSTQMTLNTFHLAGVGGGNVTLGIPRMREILMTASREIKTPMMTLSLKEGRDTKDAEVLCKQMARVTLFEVVDQVIVKETTLSKAQTGGARQRQYEICLKILPDESCTVKFNQIYSSVRTGFLPRIIGIIAKQLKKKLLKEEDFAAVPESVPDVAGDEENAKKAKKKKRDEDRDEEEDDYDEDMGGAAEREKSKHKEGGIYDDAKDDDSASGQAMDTDSDDEDQIKASVATHAFFRTTSSDKKKREIKVVLAVPADSKKLLMVRLVEQACEKTLVRAVKGINRCFVMDDKGEKKIQTEGVNFEAVWEKGDIADLNKIRCNDIWAIMQTYGVEAGRQAIMNEISGVFGVYGISVDKRHLSLIADYMTFDGDFRPFNRMGMEKQVSPFLKMSYETTTHFLTQATLSGDYDNMKAPSASIVLGKPVDMGTGSFDLLQPLR